MDRHELTDLLSKMAESDLVDGADIYDHPFSVAIRAINQCFDDINYLRGVIKRPYSGKSGMSKKARHMVELNYNPEW